MAKFRKKPTVIEAWQWNGEKEGEMPGVCQCDSNSCPHLHTAHENTVNDRGQLVFLSPGDWIIPEVKMAGRYYPCKPNVFEETYEAVEEIEQEDAGNEVNDAWARGEHIPGITQ